MATKAIELGDTAKDTVSGFTGVVTADLVYLNGCHRVALSPPIAKDGTFKQTEYFDVEQCVVVKKGTHKRLDPGGGPMEKPSRLPNPMPRHGPVPR
jgi:hypothetical protein